MLTRLRFPLLSTTGVQPHFDSRIARDAQEQLSARLHARDSRAFCDLYDSTVSYVYKLARCVADEPGWAECVTESVFSTVWRSPETVDSSHGSVHEGLADLVFRLSTVPASPTDAGSRCLDATAAQHLRTALRGLTQHQRAALDLVYFAGQSLSSAATSLDASVIDVARNLKFALATLHEAQLPNSQAEAAPDVA